MNGSLCPHCILFGDCPVLHSAQGQYCCYVPKITGDPVLEYLDNLSGKDGFVDCGRLVKLEHPSVARQRTRRHIRRLAGSVKKEKKKAVA